MQPSSSPENSKLRPIFLKRIIYIALGFSIFFLILALSTPNNYREAAILYFLLSLTLFIFAKLEKYSLVADCFIIGFAVIEIFAAYSQRSAYVFCLTTVLIVIAAFLKSIKYVTVLFIALLSTAVIFLALGIFTFQQTLIPGYGIALVNNVNVALVMLTIAYPQALFIQKVLITKLKSNELTLQESEGRFRHLFEESPIAIALYNTQGELIEVNQAYLDLFGVIDQQYLKGFRLFDDPNIPKDVKDNLRKGQSVRYEAPFDFEKVKTSNLYQTKRAGIIYIDVEITPLKEGKSNITGKYLAYVQEITDRKQAMQLLQESRTSIQRAYEDALQVSEMKTNLLSFASHELKTPLVPIIGWVGFLKNRLEKGKKLEGYFGIEEITSIMHACERLDKSVSKFLDLGRLESKRLILQLQDHSLISLFKNSVESITPLAQSRGIIIHSDVPDFHLQVDGFRLEEVFINILSNAIKYSPVNSHVWVSTQVKEGSLIIQFRDEGIGFTEDQLRNVWRPFSVDISQKKSNGVPSIGIGLFLSKGIVVQHGGTIAITSAGPGKGSTITISLPPETILQHGNPNNARINENE